MDLRNVLIFLVIFCPLSLFAQDIYEFPNSNLLSRLLNTDIDSDGDGIIDSKADLNDDGILQATEGNYIKEYDDYFGNITDYTGLNQLINLRSVSLQSASLINTTIDLNDLIFLEEVYLYKILNLNRLNLQGSDNLKKLTIINSYGFYDLALGAVDKLEELNLEEVEFEEFEFKDMISLKKLRLHSSKLNNLTFYDLPALEFLEYDNNYCNADPIYCNPTINLDKSPNLKSFENSPLIDGKDFLNIFSENTNLNLTYLSTRLIPPNDLDLALYPNVDTLSCWESSELDLNQLQSLKSLSLIDCTMDSINLSELDEIDYVFCHFYALKKLVLPIDHTMTTLHLGQTGLDVNEIQLNPSLIHLTTPRIFAPTVNLSHLTELKYLQIGGFSTVNGSLEIVDLSNQHQLESFTCNNNNLISLNLKNGAIETELIFDGNPNLKYLCFDEEQREYIDSLILAYEYTEVEDNAYCPKTPSEKLYTLQGNISIDLNKDGICEGEEEDIFYDYVSFKIKEGMNTEDYIVQYDGSYSLSLPDTAFTLIPYLQNTNDLKLNPNEVEILFEESLDTITQNFCTEIINDFSDLSIVIIPISNPTPGFQVDYKIQFTNLGFLPISGNVTLDFDELHTTFISSSPNETSIDEGTITWDYENLQASETREIFFTLELNKPTDPIPLNQGDILPFLATIFPFQNDANRGDNFFQLQQDVINSFDPNDKICLQGEFIVPDMLGEYIYYRIRFENLGTANAVNISVVDEIDTLSLNIESFQMVETSHECVTSIKRGNIVEFYFENIQLPFNDEDNDGYIIFRIKTMPDLVLGDAFNNKADIYFDFNFPVITNEYTVTIADIETSAVNELTNYDFSIYPNPTKDQFILNANIFNTKWEIFNQMGELVQSGSILSKTTNIDVKHLDSGLYFVKVNRKILKVCRL